MYHPNRAEVVPRELTESKVAISHNEATASILIGQGIEIGNPRIHYKCAVFYVILIWRSESNWPRPIVVAVSVADDCIGAVVECRAIYDSICTIIPFNCINAACKIAVVYSYLG